MAIGGNPCGCPEGITNCEEAYDCITTHICEGRGLRVDDAAGCFGVALGSCLGFDARGRIAYICGDAPAPSPCQVTFDSVLASGEFIVGGRGGGSSNLMPWGSPQAIDYALDHGVQLIDSHCFALDDGSATWSPLGRHREFYFYAANPASNAWSRESQTWMSTRSNAGCPDESCNFTGRWAMAPDARKTPDGGWFGYRTQPYALLLATQALSQVDGRALVNLYLPNPLGVRDLDVTGAVQAINTACAQQWAMVTVGEDDLGRVPTITGAGITACVEVVSVATMTPQDVIDSGATWVNMSAAESDEVIQPYIDSGLHVLVRTNARQYETARAQDLGATGVVCNDPVYAADNFRGSHSQSWAGRGNALGILDYRTDQGFLLEARGYTNMQRSGLFLWNSPTVAAEFPPEPTTLFQNELIGVIRPDDVAVEWPDGVYGMEIALAAYWDTVPQRDGSRMGIAFGSNFDTDLSGAVDGLYGDRYRALRSGYFFWVDVEDALGTMRLERLGPAGTTPLALTRPVALVPQGEEVRYELTVTPTTIRVDREDGEFVEAVDDTYRGKWMYACTQYANDGTNTDNWETVFRFFPNW